MITELRKDTNSETSDTYRRVFHEIFIVDYDVARAIEVVECFYGS